MGFGLQVRIVERKVGREVVVLEAGEVDLVGKGPLPILGSHSLVGGSRSRDRLKPLVPRVSLQNLSPSKGG